MWSAVHFHIGIGFEIGFRVIAWGYAGEPGDTLAVAGGETRGDEVVRSDDYGVEGHQARTQDAEIDLRDGPEGSGAGRVIRIR